MRENVDPILLAVLTIVLIISAIIDVRIQKIPNLLTFPTMIAGGIYHSVANGWEGLFFSLGGLALGVALFSIPYLMGGMGAGDAKLVGAVGAIIGPKGVAIASLFIAIAGGFYALIVFVLNIEYLKNFISRNTLMVKTFAFTRHLIPIPADKTEKKPKLCYGVAIAIGTLFYILFDLYAYTFVIF